MQSILRKTRRFFSTPARQDSGIIFLYLLLLILFFGKTFLTTYMHGDFVGLSAPNYKYFLDSLRSGTIPFWQPYSYLGIPEIFKLELNLFYPVSWIVILGNLLFNHTNNFTIVGKSVELMQYFDLFMGATGMYLLLRRCLKLPVLPSFFAGFIYSFSIYATIQVGDLASMPGKMYLPWIIFLLLRFLQEPNYKNYIFLVFINYINFSFGYPYYYFYYFLAEISLTLFFGYKKTLGVLIAYGNAALISAFFLLPSYHILNQSLRGSSPADDPFFHLRYAYIPTKLINIFDPLVFSNIFDKRDPLLLFSLGMLSWGVISLIFLVIGFIRAKVDKVTIWLYLIFVLGFIISLGGYLTIPQTVGLLFPFVDKFRTHVQVLIFSYFAGTIFIAYGIDAVINKKLNNKVMIFFWELVLVLFTYLLTLPFYCKDCTANATDVIIGLYRSLILLVAGLVLVYITAKTGKKIFIIVILAITFLEFSFYFHNVPYQQMPTSYADYYKANSLIVEFPSLNNLFRYSFVENQFIYNTSSLGIFNKEGYETVPSEFLLNLNNLSEIKRFQFTNTKYLVTTESDEDKTIPGLKLIKTVDPAAHPDEVFYGTVNGVAYFSPQRVNKYYIYQVKEFVPRFFVPKNVTSCLYCVLSDDFFTNSYVRQSGVDIKNPDKNKVKIQVISYSPNRVQLEVNTFADTFVASSEIWDKGWSVTVNGKKSVMYSVDGGFRGFIVSAGKNTVVMSYFPPYLYLGLLITFGGIILLLALYQYRKKLEYTINKTV